MERKIGEIITFNDKQFEVIKGSCKDCYFTRGKCLTKEFTYNFGMCVGYLRHDLTNVAYKLINNKDGNEETR